MADVDVWLCEVATAADSLLEHVVFVGGAITHLLITDTGAFRPRATKDVDLAVVSVSTYRDYVDLSDGLRRWGFREDLAPDAPSCRWLLGAIRVDVIPAEEGPWGATNKWYRPAFEHAHLVDVGARRSIRAISGPYFVATKLDAFEGRGAGDVFASHDVEDIVAVVDGRPELIAEVRVAPLDVRSHIAAAIESLLVSPDFAEMALPGHLGPDAASQARAAIVLNRLRDLARVRQKG